MSFLLVLKVIILVKCSNVDAAKILAVFPMPAYSHQVVFRHITNELVRRGHDVIVITPTPQYPDGETPINLREISVHDVSYEFVNILNTRNLQGGTKGSSVEKTKQLLSLLAPLVSEQLKYKEVKEFINKERNTTKFDLILVEAITHPALVYSHIFKAPVITVSSFGGTRNQYNLLGAAVHPILYPNNFAEKKYNLTMFDKLNTLYINYCFENFVTSLMRRDKEIIEKALNESIPTFPELLENVAMIFVNYHHVLDFNRPVPPNVVYLGGLYSNPIQKIPEDLQSYLDYSKNGVIYVSFGSNGYFSRESKENQIAKMVHVLSTLSYDVLWKWDEDELPGRTENMRIGKWFPQPDLLRHPKIKLFITQCGLQSMTDAIEAAVPLLGVPLIIDQWFNAEDIVHLQIGQKIIFQELDQNNFRKAVLDVLENKSYKENINKLRSILIDMPQSALGTAIYWIEYVIRHKGAEHLRSSSWNISTYEYYEVTLVITVISIILSIVFAVFLAVTCCYKYLKNKSKRKLKLY